MTGWIDADTASSTLGVRKRTLYTYVSRGWIRTRSAGGRRRLYLRADVLDLKRRADAHRGQAPAAASAMHWGPPVLPSAITSVDVDGPNYRGVPALTLAERDTPFEQVCELLWQDASPWPSPAPPPATPAASHPLRTLQHAVLHLPPAEPSASFKPAFTALVAALAAPSSGPLAERIAAATSAPDALAVQAALTVCADHELNPSTFAARIAASAGSTVADAVLAGLCTLAGRRHGGVSDLATDWLHQRAPLPHDALDHPLYPGGDPRAEHLIDRALQAAPPRRASHLRQCLAQARTHGRPNLDLGLAALAYALDAAQHAALAWFAVARIAGLVAHINEQRTQPGPVRPRARYIGP